MVVPRCPLAARKLQTPLLGASVINAAFHRGMLDTAFVLNDNTRLRCNYMHSAGTGQTGTSLDLYKSFFLLLMVKYREIDDHRIILRCH